MTDHTFTADVIERIDPSSSDLSAAVRATVGEALPDPDRSLPILLCWTVGEAVSSLRMAERVPGSDAGASLGDDTDPTLEISITAVAHLEAYTRLRRDVYDPRLGETRPGRDTALLASDYLHAAAYEVIGEAAVADERHLELFRILVAGSSALAQQFLTRVATSTESADAVLASVACELGATAAGARREAAAAFETYGRELEAALETRGRPDEDRGRVIRTLAGENVYGPETPRSAGDRNGDRHGERAHAALERALDLASPSVDADVGADGATTRVATNEFEAVARLESATRIPIDRERLPHE